MVTTKQQQEIKDFYAKPNWCVDDSTPQHIQDAFVDQDFYSDPNAPKKPDMTPIFHGGVLIGTRQDIIDGKIDPTDRDAWKP